MRYSSKRRSGGGICEKTCLRERLKDDSFSDNYTLEEGGPGEATLLAGDEKYQACIRKKCGHVIAAKRAIGAESLGPLALRRGVHELRSTGGRKRRRTKRRRTKRHRTKRRRVKSRRGKSKKCGGSRTYRRFRR